MTRNRFIKISAFASTLLIFMLLAKITLGARVEEEAKVKAAYIYNFCKYVTWPASATNDPVDICILGKNPLARQLPMLSEKKIGSRDIAIKLYSSCSAAQCCEVLYISATEKENLADITETLKGLPVLTISDIQSFAEKGGMIELVKQGKKIRFIINKQSLDKAGLTISSRLLKLATIVNGK